MKHYWRLFALGFAKSLGQGLGWTIMLPFFYWYAKYIGWL